MKPTKPEIKLGFGMAGDFPDLRAAGTGVMAGWLEELMKLRETPIEKHILRQPRRQLSRD